MRFFGYSFFRKIIIVMAVIGFCLFVTKPISAADVPASNGAVEWQWPTVPGVGSLSQALKSDADILQTCRQTYPNDLDKQGNCVRDGKSQQLGFVVKYFLYLFFYIISGVCVILVILAGVSYVSASKNVQKLLDAKAKLRNALLGLFIVASSWALLYLINPNLLLFQPSIPVVPPVPVIEGEKNGSNVTFATFSVREMIDYVIASSTVKNPATGEMAILGPYRRAQEALKDALLILQGDPNFKDPSDPNLKNPGLKKLLEFCQCGQSYSHLEKEGALTFAMQSGKSGDDIKKYLQNINASGRTPDTQDLCLTRCDNCGTLEGQQPEPKNNEYRPCMLNDVLTVSTKKDPADPNKVIPLKCPRPLAAADYKKIWILGKSLVPLYKGAMPAQWAQEDESWEKCEFVYFDIDPNYENDAWAVLAVFYPESTGQKWIEFTNKRTGNSDTNDWYLAYSIKYHIAHLFKIVPQLQAIKLELASDQIEKLGKVLASNAMDYLLSEGHGGIFQPEIDDEKRMLASRGFDVNMQEFMGSEVPGLTPPAAAPPVTTAMGKTPFWAKFKILAALDGFIQPFQKVFASQPILVEEAKEPSDDRFYVVTNVETFGTNISPYDEQMVKQNKLVLREASRANLFAVLAGQTLEQIEAMVGDCMAAAFGEAKYDLPVDIEDTIRAAINQGTADYVVYEFAKNNDKFAAMIGQEVADQVSERAAGTLKKRCAEQCNNDVLPPDIDAFLKDEGNKKCVEQCEKANIPPDFVSNAIGQFLSQPLVLRLPGEIGKDLDSKLKEVLKESDVVAALDKPMIDLYNKVLHKGLSKSFADQIPALRKTLDTNIYVYLTESLSSSVLSKIDSFLNFRVSEYLKKKIHEQAEKVAGGLTNEFDKLVEKGVDYLKESMPRLFPESILSPDECNATELLEQGYLWRDSKCSKLTFEEINEGADAMRDDGGPFPYDNGYLNIDGEEQTRQMLCERVGGVWSQYFEVNFASKNPEEIPNDDGRVGIKEGDWTCGENQWGWGTNGLGELTDVKQLGRKALAGAINFVSEFSVALTATIMNTVMAYTDVWVEDEVLAPLENYISQFSGLQDGLKKFLHTSVQDILPDQISQTLNGNVDKALKDICAKAPPEPTDPEAIDPKTGKPLKETTQTFTLSLYGEKTYGTTIDLPDELTTNENLWKVCDISQHLHTTLAKEISSSGEIGKKIIDIFNTKVVDLIPWDGAKDLLKKSPAGLIFEATGLKDIDKLVTGSPVDLLCGRLIQFQGGEFGVLKDWPTLEKKCSDMKVSRPISVSGYSSDVLTFPETDMAEANKEENPQFWRYYCPIIWGACTLPGEGSIPLVGQTVGGIAKSLLTMLCNLPAEEARLKSPLTGQAQCKGSCLGNSGQADVKLLQNDLACPQHVQNECWLCNFALNDSVAYTLLEAAIDADFGPVADRNNDPTLLPNEIEVYRWLEFYFPLWASEIDKVARSRGINEIGEANRHSAYIDNLNLDNAAGNMDTGDWLKVLVAWRLGKTGITKTSDILVRLPDGIIKPAKKGDATMLLGAGQGASMNILGLTPSQLWQVLLPIPGYENGTVTAGINANFVCRKVEEEYARKYPTLTFDAIRAEVIKSHPQGQPYSMEGLDRPTTAEVLNRLSEVAVADGYGQLYLLCQYLKRSPSQIFGLDQELIHYIQPKEYQLLFQLIEDELIPDERPESLNRLLGFLNSQTPTSALEAVKSQIDGLVQPNEILADHWWYNGSSATIKFSKENTPYIDELVGFLDTPLGEYLNQAQITLREKEKEAGQTREQTIIEQLCNNLQDTAGRFLLRDICQRQVSESEAAWWEKIQSALLKTPIDLLAAALPWKVPNPPGWDKSICKPKLPGKACATGEYILERTDKNNKTGGDLCCKQVNSLMEAVGLYWPPLGQPYIDSLFNAAGKTVDMYNFLDEKAEDWDNAGKRWEKGKSAVAGAIDKVVWEEPTALLKNVVSKVANLVGIDIGNNLGDTMAGRCWEQETACAEGQVARTTTDGKKECCDAGGALVCAPKCRAKDDVPCKEKQGEFASSDGKKCCYAFTDKYNKQQECQKCRELISADAGGKCNREGEELFEQTTSGGRIKLCCKKRDVKKEDLKEGQEGPTISAGDTPDANGDYKACCETIDECVTAKFLNHLEVMKSFLVDGLPINSLFPPKTE